MNTFKKITLILVASLGMGTAAQAGIFSALVERCVEQPTLTASAAAMVSGAVSCLVADAYFPSNDRLATELAKHSKNARPWWAWPFKSYGTPNQAELCAHNIVRAGILSSTVLGAAAAYFAVKYGLSALAA